MRALLPLALGLLPLGCYHDIHDPFEPSYQVQDQEPNNDAFNAQGVGALSPGLQVDIYGYVAGQNGFGPDGVDGFAFVANTPLVVDFALIGQPGWYSDLDLCLYDPYSGTYVDCWQSWDNDEYGSFYVPASGQEFHLVVVAANGSANYVLSLNAHAAGGYYSSSTSAEARGFARTSAPTLRPMAGLDAYRAPARIETPEVSATEAIPVGFLMSATKTGQWERRPLKLQPNGEILVGRPQ
jgi:hypothetical protein